MGSTRMATGVRSREDAVLLTTTMALAIVTPIWSPGVFFTSSAFGIVALLSFLNSDADISWLALTFFIRGIYWAIAPGSIKAIPALPFLLPVLLAGAIISLRSPLPIRQSLTWFRVRPVDRTTVLLLLATGILSAAALLGWAAWTSNLGFGVKMVEHFARYPFWFIAGLGIPAFALTNALAEELVYRGVMQDTLNRVVPPVWLVLVLQAAAFAAVHFAAGFPNGVIGYGMVFGYGVALGYLRRRTGGLLVPLLAHVLADMTIGCFMIVRLWP